LFKQKLILYRYQNWEVLYEWKNRKIS
jgi:hypothetical protein